MINIHINATKSLEQWAVYENNTFDLEKITPYNTVAFIIRKDVIARH